MSNDEILESDDGAVMFFYLIYGMPEEATIAALANAGPRGQERFRAVYRAAEALLRRPQVSQALLKNKAKRRAMNPATGFFYAYMAHELLLDFRPGVSIEHKWSGGSLMQILNDSADDKPDRYLLGWGLFRGESYCMCRDSREYWAGTGGSFARDKRSCWTGEEIPAEEGADPPQRIAKTKLSNDYAAKAAASMNRFVKHYNANWTANYNHFPPAVRLPK